MRTPYRSSHLLVDVLELQPKTFQLGDLIRHGVKLCPNERTQPRTQSGLRATIECGHQRLELLKRQPQRTGPTDES